MGPRAEHMSTRGARRGKEPMEYVVFVVKTYDALEFSSEKEDRKTSEELPGNHQR